MAVTGDLDWVGMRALWRLRAAVRESVADTVAALSMTIWSFGFFFGFQMVHQRRDDPSGRRIRMKITADVDH
jgi:hypothetical protein